MIQIKLEDTLHDFFAAEDIRNQTWSLPKTFVSYNPISNCDLTPALRRNTKYIVQQWRGSSANDCSPIINLVLMPQRMAWLAGKITVIFFEHAVSEQEDDPMILSRTRDDLEQTLAVLDPGCRFAPAFYKSPEEIHMSISSADTIPYLPSDGLANLRHYISPDDHYMLLSKRGLALSGLPTPKAQLVDFDVPKTGWDGDTLNDAIARAINAIHHRQLPCVLKSNSAGGSKGTYLIHTMEDRATVEVDIMNILIEELPKLNLGNAHLHPFSLIMTDFLPGDAISLNFYVRSDGKAQFSSCTTQTLSDEGFWLAATLVYSAQAHLASRYAELIQATAKFLHSHGYHGPTGIDVMTDEAGVPNIVDLNPRPTASFVLGCLRPHFSDVLGMDAACTLPFLAFSASRTTFEEAFEKELQMGQIVVLAWYSDLKAKRSHTCLAVSAVDKNSLNQLYCAVHQWVLENQSSKRSENHRP